MRNLTLYSTIFLIAGILTSYSQILSLSLVVAITPLILFAGYYLVRDKKMILYIVLLLSFFIFGFFTFNQSNNNPLDNIFGKEVEIVGKVIEIDKFDETKEFMKLLLKSNVKFENNTYNVNIIAYTAKNTKIKTGMTLKGTGSLVEPSEAKNQYEFDYKRYLNNNDIKSIFFLDESYQLYEKISFVYKVRNDFQDYIISSIDKNLNVKGAGLLKGIILGNSDFIEENLLSEIRLLGIAHVLAVSGLHIGIIISFWSFIFRIMRFTRNKSLIISLILTWIYAFLIGFPISVLRALIMFSFMSLGLISHRKYNIIYSIILSVNLMLLFKPLWLFDTSFQLSFAAISSIALFVNMTNKYKGKKFIKTIVFLLFIQIFTLPITIYYFNSIPIFSLFINLLFVPVISIVLILSIISLAINLVFPSVSYIIFLAINSLLKFFIYCSNKLINMNLGGVNFYSPNLNEIIIYFLIMLTAIYFINNKIERYRFNKLYSIIFSYLFLYILAFIFYPSLNDGMKISIIDVGQGAASLIQYEGNDFMIDAGGEVSLNYELADVLLPSYLIKRGVKNLDTIFITHYHSDHYSGLDKINEKINIDSIVSYDYNEDILNDYIGMNFYKMNRGDDIQIDNNFNIEVLWPINGIISKDENQNSMVLLLNYYKFKILFTGDIDKAVEDKIIKELSNVDILIVPHHGSDTSSGEKFINKLNPKYAIMSYGTNNYGIPSLNVIKNYNENGAKLLSTFEDGEIIIKVAKNGSIKINTFNNKESLDYLLIFLFSILCVLYIYLINLYLRSIKLYE